MQRASTHMEQAPQTPLAPVASPAVDPTSLLARENFATRFARGELRNRRVMRLHALLERLGPELPNAAFAEWLEDLFHWLRERSPLPEQRPGEPTREARLRTLLEALDFLPAQRDRLRAGVARLFASTSAVTLFTDVGLPSRHQFVSEFVDRLARATLPEPRLEDDLAQLMPRLFPNRRAVSWFEGLPPELGAKLFDVLARPEGAELEPLLRDMRDAALLLATRIGHHGLAHDVRSRSPKTALQQSPFFVLPRVVEELVFEQRPAAPPPAAPAARGFESEERKERSDACRDAMVGCRRVIKDVRDSLEHTGVSVDLVYRLDLMRQQLDRLHALLAVLAPLPNAAMGAGMRLVRALVYGGLRDRSVVELFRSSTRLLSRRLVDSAAHSGGNYITRTRAEWHALLESASGGGVVTAFAALFKFFLAWAGMAPFWEGFFFSLNYAGAFVSMQLLGFTLASRQPAMTAAHLARALGESKTDEAPLEPLAAEVARTVRSQLAATIGNLAVIVPMAAVMDLLFQLTLGHGLLDAPMADAIIASDHPLLSGIVPGSMLTGVALWISSVAGGAVENWAVYQRIPQALASSRLMRAFAGPARAERIAQWVRRHAAGIGSSIALGLQMGMVPAIAGFFGLPLTLPHVSIATGQLAFAGMARGAEGVLHADFLWAVVGVGVTGLMNFGVSFALALWVALRARDVGVSGALQLLRAVGRLFRARPLKFVLPPKE